MTEELKDSLLKPMLVQNEVKDNEWISSGSTLVNLAASGRVDGALAAGKYFWLVGDSSSGKTFITLTCLAEAANNKNFDEYEFVFDNAEDGALMNLPRYFGSKMVSRLQPPRTIEGRPIYSHLVEEFYFHLDDRLTAVEKGKAPPFIYLLDSMDALHTEYARKKFGERKNAARGKGREARGDYGDGKAKFNSVWIRDVVARLRDTKSTLIILSQTRDKLDAERWEDDKTFAGGWALKFYATWQLWSSVRSVLWKKVNDKDRQIGINARIAIKKNRLTGKEWAVDVPIYHSYGIDDVGSCVDFMVDEGYWKSSKTGVITAEGLDLEGQKKTLIKHIEAGDLEFDLRQEVASAWREIEEKCKIPRKRRYE